jgi:hypothetical protein
MGVKFKNDQARIEWLQLVARHPFLVMPRSVSFLWCPRPVVPYDRSCPEQPLGSSECRAAVRRLDQREGCGECPRYFALDIAARRGRAYDARRASAHHGWRWQTTSAGKNDRDWRRRRRELLACFQDADDLVEPLRKRAASVGLSYGLLDAITGLGEGSTGKYLAPARVRHLSISSLLKITEALGLRPLLVVDEALIRKMQRRWSKRDASEAHARRPPSLGQAQLRRMLRPIAVELGRRGHAAFLRATTPERRKDIGRLGAAVRWGKTEATPDQQP